MSISNIGLQPRSESHIIDTRASRLAIVALPDDLLVRSMEERDYGIDIQIELFDKTQPSGKFALIQLKGKQGSFDQIKNDQHHDVSLSIKIKLLKYALLFNIPFIIFHTSIDAKKTKFLWLQKYIEIKLGGPLGDWSTRDNDSEITIHFPKENILNSKTGKKHLRSIIEQQDGITDAYYASTAKETLVNFGMLAINEADYSRDLLKGALSRLKTIGKFVHDNTKITLNKYNKLCDESISAVETYEPSEKFRKKALNKLTDLIGQLDLALFNYYYTQQKSIKDNRPTY